MSKNIAHDAISCSTQQTNCLITRVFNGINAIIYILIIGIFLMGCGGGGGSTGGNGINPGSSGEEWTQFASGTTGGLTSVAYGNGVFVAVGTLSGKVLTSTDGKAWIQRNSGNNNGLYGVAYGNGKFIAVGLGGTIMESIDGINWTIQNFGANGYQAITYGNGKFVVVGYNGVVYTSTDGSAWVIANSQTTEFLFSVCYGNGSFVAVGANGKIISSPDGVNWTNRVSGLSPGSPTVADNNIIGITYGNGKFYAVTWSWSYNSHVLNSVDGNTWLINDILPPSSDMSGIVYGNGVLVMLNGYIYTSSDGINWTQKTNGSNQTITVEGVTYGDGKFVAVGSGILYSDK